MERVAGRRPGLVRAIWTALALVGLVAVSSYGSTYLTRRTVRPEPGAKVVAATECEATHVRPLRPVSSGSKLALPNYGFGSSPAYLSGEINWYQKANQVVLLLVKPRHDGRIVVAGHEVVGDGVLDLTGTDTKAGQLRLPRIPRDSSWRLWVGRLNMTKAGCYVVQMSGVGVRERVILSVSANSPPLGAGG